MGISTPKLWRGYDVMVTTESVTIQMPVGMSKYLKVMNTEMELIRNATGTKCMCVV